MKPKDRLPKVPGQKDAVSNEAVSDEELARFLKNLSFLYRDRRTGNPMLADALLRTARNLGHKKTESHVKSRHVSDEHLAATNPNFERLRNLNARAVEQILADNNKSKTDLIELAWARFSIAKGKLLKSSADVIKQSIRSALSHEQSIKIISQEAHKRGSQRSS